MKEGGWMAEYIKIPRERVGVLIGHEGETKRLLEKKCNVKLNISSDGSISIISPEEDGLREWKALHIVKAIGRGFNPRHALVLLGDNYVLSIINIYELSNGKEARVRRIRARVIGEGGKAKTTIETLTKTRISVYGKTISIIGKEEDVEAAERGIEMLIDGARHATVYKFLERTEFGARS